MMKKQSWNRVILILCLTGLSLSVITQGLEKKYKTVSGYHSFMTNQEIEYFYTYTTEQERTSFNRPLIIWTNGGPGCASLSGFLQGVGPIRVIDEDNPKFIEEKDHFAQFGDLLTIDQPIGTGMSHVREKVNAKYQNNFDEVSTDLTAFVQTFLESTEIGYQEVIFVGESMSGHFIPETVQKLLKIVGNTIEIKVMLISPWVNPTIQYDQLVPYCLVKKLITEEKAKSLDATRAECVEITKNPESETQIKDTCFSFTSNIVSSKWAFYDITAEKSAFLWRNTNNLIKGGAIKDFLNYGGSMEHFLRINNIVRDNLIVDSTRNKAPIIDDILKSGVKMIVVSGDLDMISNYMGAVKWIENLDYSQNKQKEEAQFKYKDGDNDQTYFKFGNIAHFNINGAGHMISIKKPKMVTLILKEFVDSNV